MDENKKLAIELTKALIQNNNVKPVFNTNPNYDESTSVAYILGDTRYTFSELVSHFLDNIRRIENWD